jgi:hypothetical protein
MSSIGTVLQPVINNSSGEMPGTINLQSDYTDVICSSVIAPVVPSTTANGSFVRVTFNSTGEYCNVRLDGTFGNHFIVKNVSAITGKIAIYHETGATVGSTINNIGTSANDDYMEFNLSSGKKLSVYVLITNKISVTYL